MVDPSEIRKFCEAWQAINEVVQAINEQQQRLLEIYMSRIPQTSVGPRDVQNMTLEMEMSAEVIRKEYLDRKQMVERFMLNLLK